MSGQEKGERSELNETLHRMSGNRVSFKFEKSQLPIIGEFGRSPSMRA